MQSQPDLTTLQRNQFAADQLQAQRFDLLLGCIEQMRAEIAQLREQLDENPVPNQTRPIEAQPS